MESPFQCAYTRKPEIGTKTTDQKGEKKHVESHVLACTDCNSNKKAICRNGVGLFCGETGSNKMDTANNNISQSGETVILSETTGCTAVLSAALESALPKSGIFSF